MANDAINISVPVKFEVKSPPYGTTGYDLKALSADQQKELNTYKMNIRKENTAYIKQHPEIEAIISWITRMTIIHRPRDVTEFIAKLFTRPERQIKEEIKKILNESEVEFSPIPNCDFEDWDY